MAARRGVSVLAIGAALRLAAIEPGSFLTAPQRVSARDPISSPSADVSADGRSVAFESYGRLVPADTDDRRDIYVLDLETRQVTLESVPHDGQLGTAHPRLSGDGRFLVFEATTQPSEGAMPRTHIVLCDRRMGSSTIVSAGRGGAAADGSSRDPDISGDGRIVVFVSNATNLVAAADLNGDRDDVYALDVAARTVERISLDAAGKQPSTGGSFAPAVSADGHRVAFTSSASLMPAAKGTRATPGLKQVYLRDLAAATTTRVSASSQAVAADRDSWAPSISGDGRFVAFVSEAGNLGVGARNRTPDVFLRDLQAGTVSLVSRTADGVGGSGVSGVPSISADGRFVAFQSDAPDLVCSRHCPSSAADINLLTDIFLFDRDSSAIVRVSQDEASEWMEGSRGPALDGSGRVLAFASGHPIDALDSGNDFDLFVKILAAEPASPPQP